MSAQKPQVLIVLTSDHRGWYLPELAHPFEILAPYFEITIASHAGGEAPLDQSSVTGFKDDEICSRFYKTQEHLWKNTAKLEDFKGKSDQFDAILYVGGYGPMFDLVDSEASAAIIGEFHSKQKLVTAICHGPAVLAHLKTPGTGKNLLEGHRVTGISNLECEMLLPSSGIVEPWNVETELNIASGGRYEKAEKPFNGHVVVSKGPEGTTIITGQNPASGIDLGKAIYNQFFGKAYPASG